MMNDPFTKNHLNQIKVAAEKINYGTSAAEMLIAELCPIQYKPTVGEIVSSGEGEKENHYWRWAEANLLSSWPKVRPLSPDEIPALKIAIMALSYIKEMETWTGKSPKDYAEEAYIKMKKLLNANS